MTAAVGLQEKVENADDEMKELLRVEEKENQRGHDNDCLDQSNQLFLIVVTGIGFAAENVEKGGKQALAAR
jgi:hypothetical protein